MLSLFTAFLPAVMLAVTTVHGQDSAQGLLQSNAKWASNMNASNPNFFATSAQGQDPKVLWFGCSDSRVPESVITGSLPGALFVHRNIANQVPPKDANSMSVLEYSVGFLSVEHVIVVGHTKCGGAAASLAAVKAGSEATRTIQELPASNPLNQWLTPLTTLGISLKSKLTSKPDNEALQFLIEENVKKQVDEISKARVIKEAWKNEIEGNGRPVRIHGWIYDLGSGLLRDLKITRGPSS